MAGIKFADWGQAASKSEETPEIIGNNATITIGDVIRFTSGFVALAAAGNRMFGLVTGLLDQYGNPLESVAAGTLGGTYTSGGLGVGTYVGASDNQTVDKVAAKVLPFVQGIVLEAPLDGTIATTTGSDLRGYYLDLVAASDQLDETSAGTGVAQFFNLGQAARGGDYVYCSPVEMWNVS